MGVTVLVLLDALEGSLINVWWRGRLERLYKIFSE